MSQVVFSTIIFYFVLQDIVTWKGELYFVDEPTADPAKLEGSLVAFTKNGQMQGIAYR